MGTQPVEATNDLIVDVYIYMHVYIHIYTCAHTHMYVYTYIYIRCICIYNFACSCMCLVSWLATQWMISLVSCSCAYLIYVSTGVFFHIYLFLTFCF